MIRRGEPGDEDALVRMRTALWTDEPPDEARAAARSLLAGEPSYLLPATVLVAETGGEVVGFVEVALRSFVDGCATDRPVGYLEGWYVAPEHRGEKIGRALVAAAEAWCRRRGCREMGSDTWLDNEASQRAHRALGFEEVDRCVNYRKPIAPASDTAEESVYGPDLAAVHHAHYGQRFHPFQIEHFLSENEQGVRYNFSESGVHPLTLGELLELAGRDPGELLATSLNYPEVNGRLALRERIAALYEGAEPDNVLVTVGASEANHLIASTLIEPGDEVVVQKPTYQQLSGNAANRGVEVKTVALVEELDWALDVEQLDERVGPATRLVTVVNPNNPTGRILTEAEMAAVVRAADRVGAWLVADEVYAGAERRREEPTPSFWGRYDRVVAVHSMSKAYGLPGLRLGWLVAPREIVADLWRRHEYATIAASMLANELGELALAADVRPKLLARARRLIRHGFDVLAEALSVHPGVFHVVPPQASAISFVRYELPISSLELAQRLVADESTLVVPGSCFGLERHFRFSSALPEAYLREGLARINALVANLG